MVSNVVNLVIPERQPKQDCMKVHSCSCGGKLFFLNEDGTTECVLCDKLSDKMFCYYDERIKK